jgi:hypothetical protein
MKKLGCLILLLAGCASEPPVLGPSILVLPGSGKTFDMFRADDTECRQYATTQSAGVDDEKLMQHRFDFAYQQCMYAKGHKVPVAGRYGESSRATQRAAPPPPPPPPPPTAPSQK